MAEMKFDFEHALDRVGKDALAVETIPFEGAEIQEGFSRIPMWVADMNFATAPSIPEAVIGRTSHPAYGYFVPRKEYYDCIIRWQEKRNKVTGLTEEAIGYENGVLGCLSTAIRTYTKPGDPILFLSPVYIGFLGTMNATDRKVIRSELFLDENNVWRIDYEDLDRKIKENHIRFCVFCSPHNPCGRVWERWEIEKAMEIYKANDCLVFSDEIWSDLTLDGYQHIPTQSVSEDARNRVIACYAPSKTFNLAGLIGSYHIIYDPEIRKQMKKTSDATGYNHMNVLSMYALIGGFSETGEAWLDELRHVFTGNVQFACDFIEQNFKGVHVAKPQGTYMLFLDCREWCEANGVTIEELIRRGIGVGVIWQDGRPFGGTHTIRMNLALPLSVVQEAFGRLKEHVF